MRAVMTVELGNVGRNVAGKSPLAERIGRPRVGFNTNVIEFDVYKGHASKKGVRVFHVDAPI